MERTIRDWQYVDRLTGLYEEMGVSINREEPGVGGAVADLDGGVEGFDHLPAPVDAVVDRREAVEHGAVDYHKAMPEERIFAKKLLAAKAEGKTLVQPRAGVPVIA